MHSRNAREISRRSIGVVRAGGFRNNVPIAKDRCILFTKKVGTAKNLVIMRTEFEFEFESRLFSGPNSNYVDEIPIPEPKRQNNDKAAKEEASNQQRKQDLHPRSQRSKLSEHSKLSIPNCTGKILELRSGPDRLLVRRWHLLGNSTTVRLFGCYNYQHIASGKEILYTL